MSKIEVEKKVIECEDGSKLELNYYIVADELSDYDEVIVLDIYGVGVDSGDESAVAKALTMDYDEAIETVQMLARNDVTPTGFYDVIDDFIIDD